MKRTWLALLSAATLSMAAACGAPEAPVEEEAAAPAVDPAQLNSAQVAQLVQTFGPPGVVCEGGFRTSYIGVVPVREDGPYAPHAGGDAYSIHCYGVNLEYNIEDPDQQWFVSVTSVEPWTATVARCFEPGQDSVEDNICWTPFEAAVEAGP